jgi:hypothetical protein
VIVANTACDRCFGALFGLTPTHADVIDGPERQWQAKQTLVIRQPESRLYYIVDRIYIALLLFLSR